MSRASPAREKWSGLITSDRAPSTLALFRAALAAGDEEAVGINLALTAAGLSLAKDGNCDNWKPAQIANIDGLLLAWRENGTNAVALSLAAISRAFEGDVLRRVGRLFPGIAATIAAEIALLSKSEIAEWLEAERGQMFVEMLGELSQADWLQEISLAYAHRATLKFRSATTFVFSSAWDAVLDAYLGTDEDEVVTVREFTVAARPVAA